MAWNPSKATSDSVISDVHARFSQQVGVPHCRWLCSSLITLPTFVVQDLFSFLLNLKPNLYRFSFRVYFVVSSKLKKKKRKKRFSLKQSDTSIQYHSSSLYSCRTNSKLFQGEFKGYFQSITNWALTLSHFLPQIARVNCVDTDCPNQTYLISVVKRKKLK